MAHGPAHELEALHARCGQHAGRNGADRPHAAELLRQVADEVARQEQPAQAQRPEGIRRDGFVSESGHEHTLPRLQAQQPPQLRRQRLGGRADIPRQRRQLQRDIAPAGLPSAASPRRSRMCTSVTAKPSRSRSRARTPASFVVFPALFSQSAFASMARSVRIPIFPTSSPCDLTLSLLRGEIFLQKSRKKD